MSGLSLAIAASIPGPTRSRAVSTPAGMVAVTSLLPSLPSRPAGAGPVVCGLAPQPAGQPVSHLFRSTLPTTHGTLHRVRPACVGPRPGEYQARHRCDGSWPEGAYPRRLPERRATFSGDEEICDLRPGRRREQLLERGQELLPQRGRGNVDVAVGGRQR